MQAVSAAVQNLGYTWDKVGNLMQRRDVNASLTEDFTYDELNRLKTSKLNTVSNLSLTYYANGNIQNKSDVGNYAYPTQGAGAVRPHAVSTAGSGHAYSYDANGNMTLRDGSVIAWTSYNLPSSIAQGGNTATFLYGAGRARYKQIAVTTGGPLPAGTETTVYIGGLFEKVTKPSGVVEYKHYVLAGKEPVAIKTVRSNLTSDVRYMHKDHLGGLHVLTNEAGTAVLRLSNDAFGKRRSGSTWSGSPCWSGIAALTHLNFTGHESLDNVELIHMNGRVYDPMLGRFISADPMIQAPLMSQSLNRYSYVMNNPLSLVDPSGFFFKKLFHSIGHFLKKIWKPLVAISVAAFAGWLAAPYLATGFWGAVQMGAIAGAAFGATTTALNGGSLGDILHGALTGGIYGAIAAGLTYGVLKIVGMQMPSKVDMGFNKLLSYANGSDSEWAWPAVSSGINSYTWVGILGAKSAVRIPDPRAESVSFSLPSLPQGFVDFWAGFGDGAYKAITFGSGDLQDVRDLLGIDGGVDRDSRMYEALYVGGVIVGSGALGGSLASKSFGRGGWLNSNRYFRIGWGKHEGYEIFRISGEWVKRHIDIFRGPQL